MSWQVKPLDAGAKSMGSYYKIGRLGRLYRWAGDEWVLSPRRLSSVFPEKRGS